MSFSVLTRSALFAALAALIAFAPTASAANKGAAQRFDWVQTWGRILPDTGIPSNRFGPKMDIRNVVDMCGIGDPDYGKIGSYAIDMNGDGRDDIITEARGYFGQGYNKATCSFAICSAERGCNISLYLQGGTTQNLTASSVTENLLETEAGKGSTGFGKGKTKPCPATAAENTTCRSDCPATAQNCPALFSYATALAWDGPVFDWSFITAANFTNSVYDKMRRADGSSKYNKPYNGNPVFVLQRLSGYCTLEEMDKNNNSVVEASEPCVKYLQFKNGRFADLYAPDAYVGVDERDERLTTTLYNCQKAQSKGPAPAQATSCGNAGMAYNSDWRAADQGLRLPTQSTQNAGTAAYQIANFSDPADENGVAKFICKQILNRSGREILIPQRSDPELSSFHKALSQGQLSGVTIEDCAKRLTSWSGQTTCPPLSCDETMQITANRNCQRSSSSFAACSECASIADPQPISGFQNKCQFSATCVGAPCPPVGGGGGDCLGAGTNVLMADGSLKAIEKIVVGDNVMGFKKDAPLAPPTSATVKAVMTTDSMAMLSINGVKVSPNHIVSIENGRPARAAKIQTGTNLVGLSGQPLPVLSVFKLEDQPSYNLDLIGADGFIADGLRVMTHPLGD